MARLIKIDESSIQQMVQDFEKAVRASKLSDGKFTYSKTLGTVEKKASLKFKEKAYLKMNSLVSNFDKEVAWHGICTRGEAENEYIVSDILVYPQTVTGATVTTDQQEYQNWLAALPDEEFNNLRFQGHSHVNMSVTPSSVDDNLYESILSQLDDTMFYVFMIINKRGEMTIKIYDLKENLYFENKEVEVSYIPDETGILSFMEEAKKLVVDRPITPVSSTNQTPAAASSENTSNKSGNSCGNDWYPSWQKYYNKGKQHDYRGYYGRYGYDYPDWDD